MTTAHTNNSNSRIHTSNNATTSSKYHDLSKFDGASDDNGSGCGLFLVIGLAIVASGIFGVVQFI